MYHSPWSPNQLTADERIIGTIVIADNTITIGECTDITHSTLNEYMKNIALILHN